MASSVAFAHAPAKGEPIRADDGLADALGSAVAVAEASADAAPEADGVLSLPQAGSGHSPRGVNGTDRARTSALAMDALSPVMSRTIYSLTASEGAWQGLPAGPIVPAC